MKSYEFDGVGVSEYFFGKRNSEVKRDDETHAQLDARSWQMKINSTEDEQCFIPPFALKNGLESAAKRLQIPVPGMKGSKFTKLFTQGVLCMDRLLMYSEGKPVKVDQVIPLVLFVPSSGKRGQGGRVDRTFPTLNKWGFHASILVFDDKITADILRRHLEELSRYIGFGAMRVEFGGVNGRWSLQNFTEVEMKEAA